MTGVRPGPAPKPRRLRAIEGNPGHRPAPPEIQLPSALPVEPSWVTVFPLPPKTDAARRAEVVRCRRVAKRMWARIVPVLHGHGLLAAVDPETLEDTCACYAELDRARRDIARRGFTITTKHGEVGNKAVQAETAYRTAFKTYIANLGLSPAARVGLLASWDPPGGASGEDDDPFD